MPLAKEQISGLGMDAWLDLAEAEVRMANGPQPCHELRIAALRVLLAVLTSASSHAKVDELDIILGV